MSSHQSTNIIYLKAEKQLKNRDIDRQTICGCSNLGPKINCIYIRTYIHTCMHTYIHTYMHAYMHAYLRTDIHTSHTLCTNGVVCFHITYFHPSTMLSCEGWNARKAHFLTWKNKKKDLLMKENLKWGNPTNIYSCFSSILSFG